MGLTTDAEQLRRQWRHFFDARNGLAGSRRLPPLYHSTGNHTVYDSASEKVFREVMPHLPGNGPGGLSYFVRRGDLLLVFVNTLDAGAGGEGTGINKMAG